MNNVVYVDFRKKEIQKSVNISKQWEKVKTLSNIIDSKLNFNQFEKLMGTTKYIDRALMIPKLTRSFKLRRYASEMIDIINEIHCIESETKVKEN